MCVSFVCVCDVCNNVCVPSVIYIYVLMSVCVCVCVCVWSFQFQNRSDWCWNIWREHVGMIEEQGTYMCMFCEFKWIAKVFILFPTNTHDPQFLTCVCVFLYIYVPSSFSLSLLYLVSCMSSTLLLFDLMCLSQIEVVNSKCSKSGTTSFLPD